MKFIVVFPRYSIIYAAFFEQYNFALKYQFFLKVEKKPSKHKLPSRELVANIWNFAINEVFLDFTDSTMHSSFRHIHSYP